MNAPGRWNLCHAAVLAFVLLAEACSGPQSSSAPPASASTAPTLRPESAAPTPLPSPTSPLSGLAGRIVFNVESGPPGCAASNACDAFADIYTIDPDGSNPRQLTHDLAAFAGSPTWDPRGGIYYLQDGSIYWMTAAGGDVRKLAAELAGADKRLAVSPDGSLIAFGWHDPGNRHPRLAVMRADGSGFVKLTRAPKVGDGDGYPTFSPDGSQIAFWRTGAIEIINVDGSGLREVLPASSGDDFHPRWSPDGQRLLFGLEGRIKVVNVDGTGLQDLGPGGDPAWSPDGAWIVFDRYRDGTHHIELAVMPAAGGEATEIWRTREGADEFVVAPAWGAGS